MVLIFEIVLFLSIGYDNRMNIIVTAQTPIDAKHCYITMGENCWGKGDTVAESLSNCQKHHPSGPTKAGYKKEKYITRVTHKNSEIDRNTGVLISWEEHNTSICPYCTMCIGIHVTIQ